MPETEAEWFVIANKIDNGQIDDSVLIATYSDDWPDGYDKNEVRYKHTVAFYAWARKDGLLNGVTTAQALPSSDELDRI